SRRSKPAPSLRVYSVESQEHLQGNSMQSYGISHTPGDARRKRAEANPGERRPVQIAGEPAYLVNSLVNISPLLTPENRQRCREAANNHHGFGIMVCLAHQRAGCGTNLRACAGIARSRRVRRNPAPASKRDIGWKRMGHPPG